MPRQNTPISLQEIRNDLDDILNDFGLIYDENQLKIELERYILSVLSKEATDPAPDRTLQEVNENFS